MAISRRCPPPPDSAPGLGDLGAVSEDRFLCEILGGLAPGICGRARVFVLLTFHGQIVFLDVIGMTSGLRQALVTPSLDTLEDQVFRSGSGAWSSGSLCVLKLFILKLLLKLFKTLLT